MPLSRRNYWNPVLVNTILCVKMKTKKSMSQFTGPKGWQEKKWQQAYLEMILPKPEWLPVIQSVS